LSGGIYYLCDHYVWAYNVNCLVNIYMLERIG